MPFPWPDTNEVAVIFGMAIAIVAFWAFLSSLLFRVLNASYLAKTPQSAANTPDDHHQNEESDKRDEELMKTRFSIKNISVTALVIGTMLTLATCWAHPAIGLIGALLYLATPPSPKLFVSAPYTQKMSVYHLRHGFFVLYSTLLLLAGPSALIWVKNLQWSHTPFASYWPSVTAIIWHIVLLCNLPPHIILRKNRLNGPWTAFAMGGLMALFYLFRVPPAANFLLWIAFASSLNFILSSSF